MNAESNYDSRTEPRFHPTCEQVRWRKAGSAELRTGQLLDISNMGLSFRALAEDGLQLEPGRELCVRLMGADHRSAIYSVVWGHLAEDGLAIGCARLTSDDPVAISKAPAPKLFVAMSPEHIGRKPENLEIKPASFMPGGEPQKTF